MLRVAVLERLGRRLLHSDDRVLHLPGDAAQADRGELQGTSQD